MSSIKNKGFTLVELLIVMVLSLGILSAIIMAYTATLHSYSGGFGQATLLNNAGDALEKMAKDIRSSRKVITAQPNRISLWSVDLNGNYSVEANETTSYTVEAGKIIRTTSTESGPVADSVLTLALSYDATADPRLVVIDLSLSDSGQLVTLETKAKLRNATE